jgi:hypothetical protein
MPWITVLIEDIQTNVYVTLKSINKCKTPRNNIIKNRKRNEELILKYHKNEISRYEFVKLISNHYAK